MKIPLISVVIVNYNGCHLLKDCLDALLNQSFRDFEIVLVDNASIDGSSEFVEINYPVVQLIRNNENLGFGIGNNIGIKKAKGKIIALLNNDAVADCDWLSSFVSVMHRSDPAVGMWASKILFYDNPDVIDNVGHLIYPDGLNFGRGRGDYDKGQYENEEEVFFPSGCAAFFRRAMLNDIGLFDSDFFAYGDDAELGIRARLAGWTCLYVPSAIVFHKYSATMGQYSHLKVYLIERNRIWVLIKYFPVRYIIVSPFYTIVRLMYHFAATIYNRGISRQLRKSYSVFNLIKIQLKADVDALLGIGKMIRKRKQFNKIKRRSVKEFSVWLRIFGISAKEIAYQEWK